MKARAAIFMLLISLGLGTLLAPVNAIAGKYPDRPVTMIVPWGAGGGGDRVGRVVASGLASVLPVSVPVINVTGASGQVGLDKILSEPSDGYNIIEITSDTYILFAGPHPRYTLPQFSQLAVVDQQPSGFFVREDSPWKSWGDVLRAAKLHAVKVAGSGFGTQSDVTVAYLVRKLGLKLVSVPFQKPIMRWTSVLGGHADMTYAQFGDLTTYLANKQLRPILTFSDRRLPNYPNIPTAKELGYNVNIVHFRAFAVRHGTNPAIFKALLDAMNKVSKMAKYKEMLRSESALPDSFISGPRAEKYIAHWLKSVREKMARSSN